MMEGKKVVEGRKVIGDVGNRTFLRFPAKAFAVYVRQEPSKGTGASWSRWCHVIYHCLEGLSSLLSGQVRRGLSRAEKTGERSKGIMSYVGALH